MKQFKLMLLLYIILIYLFLPFLSSSYVSKDVSITFLSVQYDILNLTGYGTGGYWLPGFACEKEQFKQSTDYHEYNKLQSWTGPLKHIERWQIREYRNRTFSMDGPCSVTCGMNSYNTITLPDGTTGVSGIILDPAAADNSNNSVNRISLNAGTPESFILSIMVDNDSNRQHLPINSIIARGEHDNESIEPNYIPPIYADNFNGMADLYQFRYDGFKDGDYIKIKFNGMKGSVDEGGGASFSGLLFDVPI